MKPHSDPDLSVVIPAFNEEARLGATLAAVRRHLDSAGDSWELIVADDGSGDGTADLVRAAARSEPRIRLSSGAHRGKGTAVRRGLAASLGRRVLITDADSATPIEELARLRFRLDEGADVAIGSRTRPQSRIDVPQPSGRRAAGRLGNRLVRALLVPGVADTQCGFKLFDGEQARRIAVLARMDGWAIDVELLHLCARFGLSVVEVPVRWSHRPGSKVSALDYARVLTDVGRIRWIHRVTARSTVLEGGDVAHSFRAPAVTTVD